MSQVEYVDARTTSTNTPKQWKFWFLLAALAVGPMYLLLLPVLVS